MSEPLCRAPWVTVYREQTGEVSPCCESKFAYSGVHASQTNEEIFRHPEVEEFKQQLLDGKWPERCANCKAQEDRDQRSFRKIISHKRYEPDFDTNSFKLRFLDHRSSNVCNFSCKMCSHHLSSTHALIDKPKGYPRNGIIEMPTTVDNIIDNIDDLKHLQFAGGEPLLMDSTWELMNMAIDRGIAKNISMGLITNGSLLNRNEDSLIEKALEFKIAHITVSVDAFGDAHDYWRHKGSWQTVKRNLDKLIDARVKDKFEVCIRTTIGWPTAWRAREVYEEYNHKVDAQHTGFINGPPHWSITQLEQDEIDRLAEYYKDWKDPYNLFKSTKSNRDPKQLAKALKDIKKADAYHKNSIVDTFPEHKDFVENYIMSLTMPD